MNNVFKTGLLALALVVGASSMVQPAQAGLSDIFTTIRAYVPALTFKRVGIYAVAAACLGAYLFYQNRVMNQLYQDIQKIVDDKFDLFGKEKTETLIQNIQNKEQVVIETINVKENQDVYTALLEALLLDQEVRSALNRHGEFMGQIKGDAKSKVENALGLLGKDYIIIRGHLFDNYLHNMRFTNTKNNGLILILQRAKKTVGKAIEIDLM